MKILRNIATTLLGSLLFLAGTQIAEAQISYLATFPDPGRSDPSGGPITGLLRDAKGDLFGVVGDTGPESYCEYPCAYVYGLRPLAGGGWGGAGGGVFGYYGQDPEDLGEDPNGPLIADSTGNIYGTTMDGGVGPIYGGAVYELSPATGNFTVI